MSESPNRRSGRNTLAVIAIVAALALAALLIYGVVAKDSDKSTIDTSLAQGKPVVAPSELLPVLGSNIKQDLGDYRGKIVVLNFWASWCEPCRSEAKALEAFQKELQAHNGTVLGVDFRDTQPDAKAFKKEFGITYPSLRDSEGKLAARYGTQALPETFVINRSGKIVDLRRGEVNAKDLHEMVDPLIEKQ